MNKVVCFIEKMESDLTTNRNRTFCFSLRRVVMQYQNNENPVNVEMKYAEITEIQSLKESGKK